MTELEKVNFVVGVSASFLASNDVLCLHRVSKRSKKNIYVLNGKKCYSEELKRTLRNFVIETTNISKTDFDYNLEAKLFNQLRYDIATRKLK